MIVLLLLPQQSLDVNGSGWVDFEGHKPTAELLERITAALTSPSARTTFPAFFSCESSSLCSDVDTVYLGHFPVLQQNLAIKLNCVKLTMTFLCAREVRNIPDRTKAK